MPETGRLIAICGIDGSGKTTQTELLARRAEGSGRAVRQVSFPRYGEGFFAELIQRYLRGEFAARAEDVSPYLAALPYGLDRWQAAPQLKRWLAEGALVLCNRYVAANMAHQGAKLPEQRQEGFFAWVAELEYEVLGLPRPDLCALLDVPPEVAAGLTAGRGERGGMQAGQDIHEGDMAHLHATAAAYRRLAARPGERWTVIACTEAGALLPPDRVAAGLWAAVQEVL